MKDIGSDSTDSPHGGVIAARGTGNGLILRIDGRVEKAVLRNAMDDFVSARKSFLSGNEVALEWVGKIPEDELVSEIKDHLYKEFDVSVSSSKLKEARKRVKAKSNSDASTSARRNEAGDDDVDEVSRLHDVLERSKGQQQERRASLFDGIEAMSLDDSFDDEVPSSSPSLRVSSQPDFTFDPSMWDEPDGRVVFGTLRSGQKVESEHSMIIVGDINSGAEVVAGGDIIVLGTLRGIAHAGAYDETGGGRIIFALNLQPTQLRIGSIISRGSSDKRLSPEVARVDGSLIVVEKYEARAFARGR
jgi:septum site-determining protein MinC